MADAIVIGAGPAGLAAAAMLKQAGAGVLGPNGRPRVHGAEADPSAPGLHFSGYSNPISGMFREINIDARRIGYAFARDRAARNGGAPVGERARAPLAVLLGIPAAA